MAANSADISAHSSMIAALDKTTIMTLSCRVGKRRLCLAVDTGATVNVMYEEGYKALKRNSRGGACVLRPNDMNLAGVTGSRLNILGVVSLPLNLSRNTPLFKADFYVISDFVLPSDGLLGLRTLRSQGIDVYPQSHSVQYCGRHLVAMEQARRLANLPSFRPRSSNRSSGRVTEGEGNVSGPIYPMPLVQVSEDEEQDCGRVP